MLNHKTTSKKVSLFLFHRDLRLDDNVGLLAALNESELVIPCFIFEQKQQAQTNEYFSKNAFEFMIESLKDLEIQIKQKLKEAHLYLFSGITPDVIEQMIKIQKIEAIYSNRDYTPFAQKRDNQIQEICQRHNVEFKIYDDSLLNSPQDVHKDDGKPYTIFTPFYNKAMCIDVKEPQKNNYTNYYNKPLLQIKEIPIPSYQENKQLFVHGGTTNARKILKDAQRFKEYPKERDNPAIEKTTALSAHNKFGTVSIREVYHTLAKILGMDHTLIKQLYWRDFLTHIAYHFPHVFQSAFDKRYQNIAWENNKEKFDAWCSAKTGFPIVDAGIRQLIQTGFMHNRVRMIVASFLVKDLHVDWRWGEKFFAQQLIDYDPAVNNGNWQWAASTGCDAQPYFRIFNPWLQQERFDTECKYIKRWLPELKDIDANLLHNLHKKRPTNMPSQYPEPIVNHTDAKDIARAMFETAKKF